MFVNMNRMKTLYFSAFIFISIKLACGIRIGEDFTQVHSNFQVTGDGFHREFRVSSSFLPPYLQDCKVLIKWTIPSGIYIDPYQLQASILNQTVHFSSPVNVEQMAHHAEPLILHSFPNIHCSSSCHFPQTMQFHLRYHLPSNTSDYTKVSLPPPVTYVACDCILPINMAVNKCLWQEISKPELPNYDVFVPVGDLSHLPFVTLLTIAIAFMGTGCVAWASVIQ
ncbi:phosphatidylinositol-glycan biosynthesis class X protein-like [Daphnia carinata]|uniref:phosphatidylinositol-glycan biosynthesis class X protein-like n=1 Tax=Daphnia carinata TaxID=120202 RepID=UPI00257C74BA|nr:phosphatidylinositol-glycan biosynthesis class X protein-like [Daphnia carinata]